MTVGELFDVVETDKPNIRIFDEKLNIIFEKEAGKVLVRNRYKDKEVAWIYVIDKESITIRI